MRNDRSTQNCKAPAALREATTQEKLSVSGGAGEFLLGSVVTAIGGIARVLYGMGVLLTAGLSTEFGRGELYGDIKLGLGGTAEIVTERHSLLTILVKKLRGSISLG